MSFSDIALNQLITLRSKVTTDNILYKGTVSALSLSYDIAKNFADITAYHTKVAQVDPTVPDKETMDYFIITLEDPQEGESAIRVFAEEWIETGTFTILDVAVTTTITIYDMGTEDRDDIVDQIRSMGYVVEYE